MAISFWDSCHSWEKECWQRTPSTPHWKCFGGCFHSQMTSLVGGASQLCTPALFLFWVESSPFSLTHGLNPTVSQLIWLLNGKGMSHSDYLRSTVFLQSRSLWALYLSIAKIRFPVVSVTYPNLGLGLNVCSLTIFCVELLSVEWFHLC